MGTRADFYIDHEDQLVWLGSVAWDGSPEGFDDVTILESTTPEEFKQRFAKEVSIRNDCTLPEHGWPWPWEDSNTTDCAYALRDGKVWTSRYGSPWYDHTNIPKEAYDEDGFMDSDKLPGDKPKFPNMKDVQNVTLGERSGMMVFRHREPAEQ